MNEERKMERIKQEEEKEMSDEKKKKRKVKNEARKITKHRGKRRIINVTIT